MKRRHFLALGAAVATTRALPSVTAHAPAMAATNATADFGVGAFLLAGSELAGLAS